MTVVGPNVPGRSGGSATASAILLKALRRWGGHLRILFAFDPHRAAILIIGGDKKGQWTAWYEQMVPVADQLYDEHLAVLKQEEELP